MTDKYTIRRINGTDYEFVRPDGTTAATFTLPETIPNTELRVPADFTEDFVTHWQQSQAAKEDVLGVLFAGVRYRDVR